jgi:hypothetical protein
MRTGREGEWTIWEINREEKGRVCGDGPAGSSPKPLYDHVLEGGGEKMQAYGANFYPIASGLLSG